MMKLFQYLTLKRTGQGYGCGQRARSYSRPSDLIDSLPFRFIMINQTNTSRDTAISKFDLAKVTVVGEARDQRSSSPSIQPMQRHWISCWIALPFRSSKCLTKFCSDWTSGSHFIVQIKHILVNQCHSRDLASRSQKDHPVHLPRHILYLSQICTCKLTHNGFGARGKSRCGGGGRSGGGNEQMSFTNYYLNACAPSGLTRISGGLWHISRGALFFKHKSLKRNTCVIHFNPCSIHPQCGVLTHQ